MRKEYDFSGGTRGEFFLQEAKLNLPVYQDKEVFTFVKRIADKKKTDICSPTDGYADRDADDDLHADRGSAEGVAEVGRIGAVEPCSRRASVS